MIGEKTKRTVLIIGAGPAGLTAAYELIKRSDFIPIMIEKLNMVGGLSRTINYKGNRIDIGGHRFFSRSDKVLNWWLTILPPETDINDLDIHYQNKSKKISNAFTSSQSQDEIMLVRSRNSRIYFLNQLFPYPISLSFVTLKKLGLVRSSKILMSYLISRIAPTRPEVTLKDFLINRFGNELYKIFFKDYTEKVWGVSSENIPAEWGKQRIKGVSFSKMISTALKKKKSGDIRQRKIESSLIEKFLYPKYGPGQLWEKVAAEIKAGGGTILMNQEVTGIIGNKNKLDKIVIKNTVTNETQTIEADFFISSMPVKDLVNALNPASEEKLKNIANGLEYRDFITVGLLVKELQLKDNSGKFVKDNWIYIQENKVKVGRLQIFNNWSPYMVEDPTTVWLGLEYFCHKGDDLWTMEDKAILSLAEKELVQIGIITKNNVLDGTVVRVEKAYPGYFGTYDQIQTLRDYLDHFENLFLVGRNGMHRYNNQDHSMLTAMEAVSKIINGDTDKSSIWAINTEDQYQEET